MHCFGGCSSGNAVGCTNIACIAVNFVLKTVAVDNKNTAFDSKTANFHKKAAAWDFVAVEMVF
jgi:hypothetical protein